MSQAIEEIVRFQTDRGLDMQGYNPQNEHTNIIEELLESIGYDVPKEQRDNLTREWMKFTMLLESKKIIEFKKIDKHYRVDAYADVIVFAVGALLKLGFNPEKVLLEVGKEINSRTGKNGKR